MEKLILSQAALISSELYDFLAAKILIMPNWKWIALAAGITIGFVLQPLFKIIIRAIKKRSSLLRKSHNSFGYYLSELPIEKNIAWGLVILLWMGLGDAVSLEGKFATYYKHFLGMLMAYNILRIIYFLIDAMTQVFLGMAAKTESAFDDQLIPFASKSLKLILVILGVLIVLQSFGLNVMSLLAGLGLGGLALALAAQDTAANLFGSITILFDSPFKVGDWVKVKDVEGTVEEIGFRSTRVRTFYNSLVTLPNSVVAKENIDNMGLRPARRSRQVLGLTYETPPEKIVQFCDDVRKLISGHKKVNPSTVVVYFNNFNSSTLDVLVQYHLRVSTGTEEMEAQMEIYLGILKIAQGLKVDFAYPTQTVYKYDVEPTVQSVPQPIG